MQSTPDKPVVLVVDDEHGIRDVIRAELEADGFVVREAANGAEALFVTESQAIDVIVSDLAMPKMGGLQLLEQLRKRRWIYPFIIVTGYGSEKAALEALRLGAFDFLYKPFDSDVLRRLVAEGVEVGRAMRAMIEQERSKGDLSGAHNRAMAMVARLRAFVAMKSRKGGAA